MRIAHDKDGNRIHINNIKEYEAYYCPACKAELVIKRGEIKRHHFAHKSIADCDTFTHDMSKWHINWQETFPEENREVVIELDITENEYRNNLYYALEETLEDYNEYCDRERKDKLKIFNVKHRADVCIGNYVIEFQHSPISAKEFYNRNWFYNLAGYNVIWVLDFKDQIDSGNMQFDKIRADGKIQYSWYRPKRFMRSIIPHLSKSVKLVFDVDYKRRGCEYILFVDWASYYKNEDTGEVEESNFKKFIIHEIHKQGGLEMLVK